MNTTEPPDRAPRPARSTSVCGRLDARRARPERLFVGIPVSAGVAIGPVFGPPSRPPRSPATRSPPPTSRPRAPGWTPPSCSRASS